MYVKCATAKSIANKNNATQFAGNSFYHRYLQRIDETTELAGNSSSNSTDSVNNDDSNNNNINENDNKGGAIGKHVEHTTWTLSKPFYDCHYVAARKFGILKFHRGHQKHVFYTYCREVVSIIKGDETRCSTNFQQPTKWKCCVPRLNAVLLFRCLTWLSH